MQIEDLGIGGFVLKQDPAYLKLGTDAVLLSDFARIPKGGRVCDLGCGNGAVAVLIAARRPDVSLCGVELLPGAAALAAENAMLNRIENRLDIICGDLAHIARLLPAQSFDAVVSNPPYLPVGSGVAMRGEALRIAKMEVRCTIYDVCRAAGHLLAEGGLFSLVYRPERLGDLFEALKAAGFAAKCLRMVQNKLDTPPSLVLVEARKGGRSGLALLPVLCIREPDGAESAEIRKIYCR